LIEGSLRLSRLLCLLLPALGNLRLEQVLVNPDGLVLALATTRRTARWPLCARRSRRVHRRYRRTLTALPWAGRAVTLQLWVRRFRCDNRLCPRRICAERLPEVAAPHARRTLAQQAALRVLGCALGGQAGGRVAARLSLPASRDTLLRLVRTTTLPTVGTPGVVGIDDFAVRRGGRFGTAVVDLEQHRLLDLLPDRSVEIVAPWLAQYPSVHVVARDRSEVYAAASSQGAPQAMQVVDRFHIIKGLGEALERFLLTKGSCLRQVTLAPTAEDSPTAPPEEAPHSPHLQRLAEASQQRLARRVEQYQRVHQLHARGVEVLRIAEAVGISRPTVYRYLHMPEPPQPKQAPQRRRALLDRYLPYLLRRWDEGCRNGQRLWAELRDQGFRGSSSTVFRATARLRRQQRAGQRLNPLPPARRHLTVRQGAMLLLRRPAGLTPRQQAARDRLCALDPAIQTAHELAQAFATLLRERRGDQLDAWVAQVTDSGIRELHRFAAGLAGDAAVRAGLTEPWSNGQTEGQITRLKLLKRQGFGRAGFGLLRARALAVA
jgi:transposase